MKHLGDLNKQLQEKVENERRQIEEINRQELDRLRQNLERECRDVESTIKNATDSLRRRTLGLLKWSLVLPAASLAGLSVIFLFASWGMTRYSLSQIQEIARNRALIEAQEKTLEVLGKRGRGVGFYESDRGTFLILPKGTKYKTDWKCGERACLKLPD